MQFDLDLPEAGRKPPAEQDFPRLRADWAPAQPTAVFATFWRFAAERQAIFFRRFSGAPAPWTDDPVLRRYKFTNAYRASDRVSQFLIRHVLYAGDPAAEEVFFRVLLFKFFNRIETWQRLERELGPLRFGAYAFDRYDAVLTGALEAGEPIFSAAYIMPSGAARFGEARKHRGFLRLLERMMAEGAPRKIAAARTMRQAFAVLRGYRLVGDFLAYQYVTDLNYSQITDFSEREFVVPGPGARDGIRKCFHSLGGLSEAEIIRRMAERQQAEFARLGLAFPCLWGRPLQLVDCQNLFCEVGKYARVAHPEVAGVSGRRRIKQVFRPRADPLPYWYPPKWGINDRVEQAPVHCSCSVPRVTFRTENESSPEKTR